MAMGASATPLMKMEATAHADWRDPSETLKHEKRILQTLYLKVNEVNCPKLEYALRGGV